MDILIILIAVLFAYWWHFQRETPREREYRIKQQHKKTEWNKHDMNNIGCQQKESDWDKHNMDQFK